MESKSQMVESNGAKVEYGTVTFQGKDYTACGAVIDPANGYLQGYVKGDSLHSWAGEFICTLRRISTWKTPYSWQSSTRSAYRATFEGKNYHGRGFGEGMFLSMRATR